MVLHHLKVQLFLAPLLLAVSGAFIYSVLHAGCEIATQAAILKVDLLCLFQKVSTLVE